MTLLDDHSLLDQPEYTNASYLQRFGAVFVDGLILSLPNMFLSLFFGNGIVMSFIQTATYIAYATYFESSEQQATIGKRLFSLKVVLDTNQPLDATKALTRAILKSISWSFFFLTLPYIFLINREQRTPYDQFLGARVVEVK